MLVQKEKLYWCFSYISQPLHFNILQFTKIFLAVRQRASKEKVVLKYHIIHTLMKVYIKMIRFNSPLIILLLRHTGQHSAVNRLKPSSCIKAQFTHQHFLNKVTFGIEPNPLWLTSAFILKPINQLSTLSSSELNLKACHLHLGVKNSVPQLTTTSKGKKKSTNNLIKVNNVWKPLCSQ